MILHKTWIEISKDNLLNNLNFFKKNIKPGVKICAVVKANAYGHGLKEVATILKNKVDFFGVDNINEALTLRNLKIDTSILILGYILQNEIKFAVENDISFVVYNMDTIEKIKSLSLKKTAKVHIKLETGLNRQGVKDKELVSLIKSVISIKDKIFIEGASMHFANIEDTLDPSFALKQIEEFKKQLLIFKKFGIDVPILHSSATAGTILHPDFNFDMVRIGIGLYGLWPSRETKIAVSHKKFSETLKPVLTWKSIIAQVKIIESGESVSYGRNWYARRKSTIAIIPIGYSDGFGRKLTNLGNVIINGQIAPVIGRVAMNMIIVDITDISKVRVEDEVILIGIKKSKEITVEEIADKIGTINYEVVARINSSIPKIII